MSSRLLNAEQLAEMLNMSKRQWARYVKDGRAPQPIRLSRRFVRWRLSDIDKWINELETERVGYAEKETQEKV